MDVYRQTVEPTQVTHALTCRLTSLEKPCLVVAKGTLLEVYQELNEKLVLLSRRKLHGLVTHLALVRTLESDLDYLAVATKYAKISVVRWSFESHALETVSLHLYDHFFENTLPVKGVGIADMAINPENNCICMLYNDLFAFLQFKSNSQETDNGIDDDVDMENDGEPPKKELVEEKPKESQLDESSLFNPTYTVAGSKLDSGIADVVAYKFLHDYRKPTLAILHLPQHTWAGNLKKQKDVMRLSVVSVDIAKKTAVSVILLKNLPYDLYDIIPLAAPLSGLLLVGCNAIIHVDSSGSSQGIIVNKYTQNTTDYRNFSRDQSSLDLMLENCVIYQLPLSPTRLLLVTSEGVFYWIEFQVEGRLVRNFEIKKIEDVQYEGVIVGQPSVITELEPGLLFFGSEDGDSLLVKLNGGDLSQKNEVQPIEQKPLNTQNDDADDPSSSDIDYSDAEEETEKTLQTSANVPFSFTVIDRLFSLAPVTNFTLAALSPARVTNGLPNPNYGEATIVASCGREKLGLLAAVMPSVKPKVLLTLKFLNIDRVWTLEGSQNYLFTTNYTTGKSDVFLVKDNLKNVSLSTEFKNRESIVAMGFSGPEKRNIVQVTPKFIYLYDSGLQLLRTVGLDYVMGRRGKDKKTEVDESFVYACFYNKYCLVTTLRGNACIMEYNVKVTKKGNTVFYDEVAIPKSLAQAVLTGGYIQKSELFASLGESGRKRARSPREEKQSKGVLFSLITADNRVVFFQKNHEEKAYQLDKIERFLETLVLCEFTKRDAIPDPFIKQAMLVELGEKGYYTEYLLVLTIGGETYFYELFWDSIGGTHRFRKVENGLITGAPENAFSWGTKIERRFVYMDLFRNGRKCLFVTGVLPFVVIKTRHSEPRVFKFATLPAISFALFRTKKSPIFKFVDDGCGFIYVDNLHNARICTLDDLVEYLNAAPILKKTMGMLIKSVTFHESSYTFVVSSFKEIDYQCLDEMGHILAGTELDKPHAKLYKGLLHLIDAASWTILDTVEYNDNQVCMTVKSSYLNTLLAALGFGNGMRKKEMVLAGTGTLRIEDLSANGTFYLYEIVDIVPELGQPEKDRKLKEIFSEETRGAVTAMTELSGRFLTASGQRVMVRDLQEDNTVVPVAFIDTAVYVSEAKAFGSLLLLGDVMKSVWLVGFDAEPYRMIHLLKDVVPVDVSSADFIAHQGDLYIAVADNQGHLHLMQYNPEDPVSLTGQRLVRKSTICVHSVALAMRLVPMGNGKDFEVWAGCLDGLFYSVTPVAEDVYRRMYVLQQQIAEKESHALGLNPKMNRASPFDAQNAMFRTGQKSVIDFDVLAEFTRLSIERRKALAVRVGRGGYVGVWRDLVVHSLGIV